MTLCLCSKMTEMLCLCRKVKKLADSDDDDDNVLSWVKKSRKIEIEREKAEQRVSGLFFFQAGPSILCLGHF